MYNIIIHNCHSASTIIIIQYSMLCDLLHFNHAFLFHYQYYHDLIVI